MNGIEMASATDRGRVRPHNEDAVAAEPRLRLAVVADGMGGHAAGEVASRMAVELIVQGMDAALRHTNGLVATQGAERLLAEHIARANLGVYETGLARPECAGMGTTVVVALWHEAGVSVGNVGDSRCYRLRAGRLEQLTEDHSLAAEHASRGASLMSRARYNAARHILTRAVGTLADVDADIRTHETAPGDLYLLCSDGLTDMLPDERIRDTLSAPGAALEDLAAELVRRANEGGGVDNISVVVARAGGAS